MLNILYRIWSFLFFLVYFTAGVIVAFLIFFLSFVVYFIEDASAIIGGRIIRRDWTLVFRRKAIDRMIRSYTWKLFKD